MHWRLLRSAWLVALMVVVVGCGNAGLVSGPGTAGTAGTAQGPAAADRVIVVFRDGVNAAQAAQDLAARHGSAVVHVYQYALRGAALRAAPGLLQRLASDPRVAYAAADQVDHIFAQTLPTGIDRVETDKNTKADIDGVDDVRVPLDVAIIDTGIQKNHPDLNVAGGFNTIGGNKNGWGDGHGHGTHVSGTVGAIDNGSHVVGVAPGVRLWGIRVCNNNGSCFISDIVQGIDWMTGRKMEFKDGAADGDPGINFASANMSLGGPGSDDGNCGLTNNDPMHTAICNAVNQGIVMVVAAGNSAANAAGFTPAAYDEVMTVSAIADFNGKAGGGAAATCRPDVDDTFADFSNFGADVDIAAPGVCILSTWLSSGTNTISGTSMATPHVTGAVALYLFANGLSPATNKAGVDSIKAAIVAAGLAQSGACGFSGDPDATHEPLLFTNATAFGGTGACDTVGP